VPIVVLVDRGTASSAELFAAALHDNGRGVLVGENTFGKGLIQRVFPMPNGGALKLTIGEYLRPNKAKVEPGIGLLPDVHCDAGDACVDVAASLVRGGRSAWLQADARHL
jgi:carboxyl-terminal processing protease